MRIGYARVSTQDQSADLQVDALREALCEEIFAEKVSGTRADRPKLEECLRMLRAQDKLVVWRLDRLGRSLQHLVATAMADACRRLAEVLPATPSLPLNAAWHPVSRHPKQAYRLYSGLPSGFLSAASRTLLADIARSNISPGLDERDSREAIRALLRGIPIPTKFLSSTEDELLTRADASPYLETLTTVDYGSQDLWAAFVHWMSYYDVVMRQEISEISLRRAQLLNNP